jgi:hypothetical protein
MSILAGAKAIGKKLFGKKKPVDTKFKTDTSSYPTSKNIDDLIKNEQDPFVRRRLLAMKEKAKKGTVIGKGGNVVGTPTKERSAKTLMDRNRGSYQYKKDGGRMGLKGGGICKKGMNKKAIGRNS